MAMKPIANESMVLAPSDILVSATIEVVGIPSLKAKAGGSGVYVDGLQISVSNITVPSASATIPDPVPYIVPISATAQKVKADGSFVLRVDDESASITATPKIPASPSPTPYPVTFTVVIQNAGQTKVNAN